MANEKTITVKVLGDASGGKKALKEVDQAAEGTVSKFGKLKGNLGGFFDDLIGRVPGADKAMKSFGRSGDDLAAGLGSASTIAAAAGLALDVFAAKSVQAFQKLGGEVLKFGRVAGTTAEESSKWVEVASDYGLSVEDVAGSVGKFEKALANTPAKIEALGVAIAHNTDGTVDMQRTMLNAADAFASTSDEVQRAKIGSELFGKSWQSMIPILEKGADGLKKAFDDVKPGKILTGEDLKNAEDFRLAIDDLKDAGEALMIQVGRGLVPALKDLADTAGEVTSAFDAIPGGLSGLIRTASDVTVGPIRALGETVNKTKDAFGWLSETITHNKEESKKAADAQSNLAAQTARNRIEHAELSDTIGAATEATQNAYKASKDNADIKIVEAEQIKRLEDAQKDETEAAKRQADANKDAADRIHEAATAADNAVNPILNLRQAHRDTEKAVRDAEKAQKDLAKARSDPQAVADAEEAEDRVAKSILQEADAWVVSRGKIKETKDGATDYANKLQDLRDGIAQQFPEIAGLLDIQIAKWRDLASSAFQAGRAVAGYEPSFGSGPIRARASGGPVSAGSPYLVGEQGPELFVPNSSGGIIPNNALKGGGGVVINVTALTPQQAGQAVVDAIKSYERANGSGWRS